MISKTNLERMFEGLAQFQQAVIATLLIVPRVGLGRRPAHAIRSYQLRRRLWWLRSGFHKSVEAHFAPVLPVRGGIVVDARPGTENTEEQVLRWFDGNPDVAVPDNQVAGFRFFDTLKSVDARVEIG